MDPMINNNNNHDDIINSKNKQQQQFDSRFAIPIHSQLLSTGYAHYTELAVVPRALWIQRSPARMLTLPSLLYQSRARLLLLYKARPNTIRASTSLALGHWGGA